jgi:thiol:disulfide interchange protein DsbC
LAFALVGTVAAQAQAAPANAAGAAAPVDAAVEAAIKKALAERIPRMPPVDEVRRTPVPGLYEVRYGGTELLYADERGDHIVVGGSLIETKTRTDLTEQRTERLLAIDFGKLPLKDALVIKQGNGSRKLAVFVDPNCGYCRRFERDLTLVKDVTIYTFLMPILGPDSTTKSRDIWCAKDPAKAWREWMIEGRMAPSAPAKCDFAALERNTEFGRRHKINGTPAVLFENGTRKPGALSTETVEKLLAESAKKTS